MLAVLLERGRMRSSLLVVLAGRAAPSAAAAPGPLQPRAELSLPAPVSAPKFPHRLTVKFRDAILLRSGPQGLVSLSGADVGPVRALLDAHEAALSPLVRLPQEKLNALQLRAAARSGRAQPDLAGAFIVDAPPRRLQQLATALGALDSTEFVYFQELASPPPCDDIAPVTGLYNDLQGYHGPDPGLNMSAAWTLGNARGAGIAIADCEYGYNAFHEDLCGVVMEPGQTIHPQVVFNGWDEHGTAVLGELVSLDNGYGCYGAVPDVEALFFTEWSVEEGFRRVTAIATAIASVGEGDIVVLEMQIQGPGGDWAPAELDPAVWMLTKVGTDAGIVVVAAAGNGNQDLDSPPYQEYMSRGDSGAIIVGAGTPDTVHGKLSFSTFGSRVNLQGWGAQVFTLGYGSFAEIGGDKNQRYMDEFSGTSSATPFVAAACAALQGLSEEQTGVRLSPAWLRAVLISTGIPQGFGGHIGPFPDVVAAAQAAACPRDLDGNGAVDVDDFLELLASWGEVGVLADFDGGGVGIADFLELLKNWGPCPVLQPDPPANDECADAAVIAGVATPFDSAWATTDGPSLPAACDEGGGLQFEQDIWYFYESQCSGTAFINTCNAVSFDARLAAYTGSCGGLTLVACSDDRACGEPSMQFPASCGQTFLIRLGGNGNLSGEGTLFASCFPDCAPPTPAVPAATGPAAAAWDLRWRGGRGRGIAPPARRPRGGGRR